MTNRGPCWQKVSERAAYAAAFHSDHWSFGLSSLAL
jgi:hypothetical protein